MDRISDALTIYQHRRRSGKWASGPMNLSRDKEALNHGIRLLSAPQDSSTTASYQSLIGSIDQSQLPPDTPIGEYLTDVVAATRSTLTDVLRNKKVSSDRLDAAVNFFYRWSDHIRDPYRPPQPHVSLEQAVQRSHLIDLRNGIDNIDGKILSQALSRGFDTVIDEVRNAIEVTDGDTNLPDSETARQVMKRREIAREIAKIKAALGIDTSDRARENEMKKARYEWGENAGLSEDEVDRIMNILLEDSKRIQTEVRSSL